MKRTLAIGDIHGAALALTQILERAEITTSDKLIFLGDFVDGWSGSFQVLETLMQLDAKQKCFFVKGNHDVWFEDWLNTGKANDNWLVHGGLATVKSYYGCKPSVLQKHREFLKDCKGYYIDDNNRLFIHAGFTSMKGPTHERDPINFNTDRTLWETARTMDPRIPLDSNKYPKRLKNFKEIFIGHTPTTNYGIDTPMQGINVWNVDTGAAFTGKLSIIDIDTKQFWQSDQVMRLYPTEKGRNKK